VAGIQQIPDAPRQEQAWAELPRITPSGLSLRTCPETDGRALQAAEEVIVLKGHGFSRAKNRIEWERGFSR
jgi:hypothetical protein